MGYGLAAIADRRVTRGVALLVAVIVVRWMSGGAASRWSERVGATVRNDWRPNRSSGGK